MCKHIYLRDSISFSKHMTCRQNQKQIPKQFKTPKTLQVFQSQSIYAYNLYASQALLDPTPLETLAINK